MKRVVHSVAAMLMLAVLLVSCGGPAQTPAADTNQAPADTGSASDTKKEPVTLTMWSQDPLYVDFFNARAKEWAKTHPEYDFTFDFQQIPYSDFTTKLLSNLAAGQPVPDLVALEVNMFPNYMKDDILPENFVDLSERIKDERDKFVEARWALYSENGKVYGVESGLSTVVYYYQPEILEKAGIEMPLKTWDDFMAAGEKLAQQGVSLAVSQNDNGWLFNELFYQHGGQVWGSDGAFLLEDPKNRQIAIDVLNLIKTGMDKKIFYDVSGGDHWGPPMYNAYQEGKVAGTIMPEWYSDQMLKAQLKDMSGKWRMAPMPVWSDGGHTTSTAGGTGFGIMKQSKHIDLAWDLLHFAYMTKENQINRYLEIHYFPTMKDAINDPQVTDQKDPYYGDQQIGKVLADTAKDAPVWYQSPFRPQQNTDLDAQVTDFFKGKITAEEAIDNTIKLTKENMANKQ